MSISLHARRPVSISGGAFWFSWAFLVSVDAPEAREIAVYMLFSATQLPRSCERKV